MLKLTLRWVTTGQFWSGQIRTFEDGFWASHNEVLMPEGGLLGAHYDGGVQLRPEGYDKGLVERELYVELSVTQEQANNFHSFLRAQLGKPYDTEAILGMLTHRDWQEPGRWFCSELVAAALCASGVWPARLAAGLNRITPRDTLLMVSSHVEVPQEALA
jgi:hypothetical protein